MIGFNPPPQTPCPPPRQNRYSCNTQTNCPNCGAPVDRRRCECVYCGTPYIDVGAENNPEDIELLRHTVSVMAEVNRNVTKIIGK